MATATVLIPHQGVLFELGQPCSEVSAGVPHQLTQQRAKRTRSISTRSTPLPAAAAAKTEQRQQQQV
jgi:hypothetical protein